MPTEVTWQESEAVQMMGFGDSQYRHSPGSYNWLRNASRNRLLPGHRLSLLTRKIFVQYETCEYSRLARYSEYVSK